MTKHTKNSPVLSQQNIVRQLITRALWGARFGSNRVPKSKLFRPKYLFFDRVSSIFSRFYASELIAKGDKFLGFLHDNSPKFTPGRSTRVLPRLLAINRYWHAFCPLLRHDASSSMSMDTFSCSPATRYLVMSKWWESVFATLTSIRNSFHANRCLLVSTHSLLCSPNQPPPLDRGCICCWTGCLVEDTHTRVLLRVEAMRLNTLIYDLDTFAFRVNLSRPDSSSFQWSFHAVCCWILVCPHSPPRARRWYVSVYPSGRYRASPWQYCASYASIHSKCTTHVLLACKHARVQ